MTRDYYNPNFGTLDVIVYVVLEHFMMHPVRLEAGAASLDQVCLYNARTFLDNFGKARSVFVITKLCGLTASDALDAYKQIVESYGE